MDKETSNLHHNEKRNEEGKTPRDSSISFIKQFARVYSTTHKGEFSYLILN